MVQFEGGPPLWHVSVAFHHLDHGIVPARNWLPAIQMDAPRIAHNALAGIGDPLAEKWEIGIKAIHLRRVTTQEERARLGGDIAAIRGRFAKGGAV